MSLNQRIRVKLETGEEQPVPSVTGLYSCAGWWEREAWDLMGIVFSGHPHLERVGWTAPLAVRTGPAWFCNSAVTDSIPSPTCFTAESKKLGPPSITNDSMLNSGARC